MGSTAASATFHAYGQLIRTPSIHPLIRTPSLHPHASERKTGREDGGSKWILEPIWKYRNETTKQPLQFLESNG
ncbi:hypothetical protein RB195_022128 [Necator americanus]|uniref:Uncharacterized protein n=1 Tax=Necator americanus TaxID=51031 RepID=A0ABR1EE09_NECAM